MPPATLPPTTKTLRRLPAPSSALQPLSVSLAVAEIESESGRHVIVENSNLRLPPSQFIDGRLSRSPGQTVAAVTRPMVTATPGRRHKIRHRRDGCVSAEGDGGGRTYKVLVFVVLLVHCTNKLYVALCFYAHSFVICSPVKKIR
jgi:hypothetical protein